MNLTCKDCGKGGFDSAWAIRRHKESAHGLEPKPRKTKNPADRAERKPRRKKNSRTAASRGGGRRATGARRRRAAADVVEQPTGPVVDAESQLLASVTHLFVNAGTDQHADERVLRYLNERFGPEAYAAAEE